MADIEVQPIEGDRYRVEIRESSGSSTHEVVATGEHVRRYAGGEGIAAERLVEASIAFLLEREPKESILAKFELPVIERYFPEYPREIRGKLS